MKIVIITGLLVGGILGMFYLAGFTAFAAGPPEPVMVMDINPDTGSNPTWLTVVGICFISLLTMASTLGMSSGRVMESIPRW
jgi:LPXTG-motif cell wall-anchored protein